MTSSSNHLKNLGALSVNVIGSSERLARTILFFNMWRFTALSIAAGKIPHPHREVNENMVRTDSQVEHLQKQKILKTELLDCILSSVADCGILRQLGYAKDVMEALQP